MRRNVINSVPRYVGKWLLMELEANLLIELQDQMLDGELYNELLNELPDVEMKRRSINEELKRLRASAAVLRKPFGA